jgi:hypothetical protein
MTPEFLGRLDGRCGDRGYEIGRAPGGPDRPVQEADRVARAIPRRRVSVEDHGIPRGQHPDGVADDRAGGVGYRRDRPDHTIGCPLEEGEPVVSRNRIRMKDFDPRCLGGHEPVLEDLVVDPTEPGFFPGHAGKLLDGGEHGFPDRDDDPVTPGQGLAPQEDERLAGRLHRLRHAAEKPITRLGAHCGRRYRGLRPARDGIRRDSCGPPRCRRGDTHTLHKTRRDARDLVIRQVAHGEGSSSSRPLR